MSGEDGSEERKGAPKNEVDESKANLTMSPFWHRAREEGIFKEKIKELVNGVLPFFS